jgi:hypothetical protein
MTRSLAWLGLYAVLLGGTAGVAAEGEFPFEQELLLETEPVPGSKRVPSLEVERNGRADLDLWCARVEAQVTVTGQTIAIVAGAARTQPCAAGQARRDEELLAVLAQATSWRREDDVVVLAGAGELRFRLSTH